MSEKYKPSEEEIRKAEKTMSVDQKISSIEREELLERNELATEIYKKTSPNNPDIPSRLKAELFMVLATQDPNVAISRNDGNALSWAAEFGERDIVRLLIKAGANVNKDIGGGRTALSYAIMAGHKDIIKDLIMAGADPYRKGGAMPPERPGNRTYGGDIIDSDMTEDPQLKQFIKDLFNKYVQQTTDMWGESRSPEVDRVFKKEFGGKAGIHLDNRIERVEEIKKLSSKLELSEATKLQLAQGTISINLNGRDLYPRKGASEKAVLELMEKLPNFNTYDVCGAKLLTPKILEKLGEKKLKGKSIDISCFNSLSEDQQSEYDDYMSQIKEKKGGGISQD